MNRDLWPKARTILLKAMDLPGEEVHEFLESACGDNEELKAEVKSILFRDIDEVTFLDRPGWRVNPETPAPVISPGKQIGPYKLLHEIGSGGMGSVYLAERADGSYHSKVAIKVLRQGMASLSLFSRFQTERQILANLNHPHIARLLDGGSTDEGFPYLVMEYVAGKPINQHCEDAQLDTRGCLNLLQKLCLAVHAAHQNLVVHRDLKPGNILVTADGEPKLLDFGIAKLLHQQGDQEGLTVEGIRPMTLDYASPEQVKGLSITTATDIYALGVLGYELLTGHRPCISARQNTMEKMDAICNKDPIKPSKALGMSGLKSTPDTGETSDQESQASAERARALRALRGDIDTILLKALRKDPTQRYPSAQEMAEDIGRHLRGFPVEARGEAAMYRTIKFLRRNWLATTAGLALTLTVLGFTIALNKQNQKTANQRLATESTADFIIDVFKVADPYASHKAEVSVVDILNNAVQSIQTRMGQTPEIRANMLETMGSVYENLGDSTQAAGLVREALALRRESSSVSDEEVADTLLNLGQILIHGPKDYAAVEAHFSEALALIKEDLGEDHLKTATAINTMAELRILQLRYKEAQALLQRAIAIQSKTSGQERLQLAQSLNNMASTYYRQKQYQQAIPFYLEAIGIRESLLHPNHPSIGDVLINLGATYDQSGKLAEAENQYAQALKIYDNALGKEHVSVARLLNNLARVTRKQGHYLEAETYYRRALQIAPRILGENSRNMTTLYNNLGSICIRLGQYDEAESFLLKALAIREKLFGKKHYYYSSTLLQLGKLRRAENRDTEALAYFERAHTIRKAVKGPESPEAMTAELEWAITKRKMGAYREAAAIVDKVFVHRQKSRGPNHYRTASVQHEKAILSFEQNQWHAASQEFETVFQSRLGYYGNCHPDVAWSRYWQAKTALCQGAVSVAAQYCDEALLIMRHLFGANHRVLVPIQDLAHQIQATLAAHGSPPSTFPKGNIQMPPP